MKQLTHGSLFAGIGGFDLGFERAGIKTVWQVEIDPFCRRVLERHWPQVPRFADIRDYGRRFILERPDIITGGFPCQDISSAGGRAGIDAARSGLWAEYLRIISHLRPRFAVLENVSALLNRGIGRLLGRLVECGYDAEWETIPACAFGFPHLRKRVFIVAYPQGARLAQRRNDSIESTCSYGEAQESGRGGFTGQGSAEALAARTDWTAESVLLRKSHGIPARMDRMRTIGNAVVPQIAEWIGRRIIAAMAEQSSDPAEKGCFQKRALSSEGGMKP